MQMLVLLFLESMAGLYVDNKSECIILDKCHNNIFKIININTRVNNNTSSDICVIKQKVYNRPDNDL